MDDHIHVCMHVCMSVDVVGLLVCMCACSCTHMKLCVLIHTANYNDLQSSEHVTENCVEENYIACIF